MGHLETCLTLRFKSGFCWHWFLEMWGERSFLRYRGELAEGKSHPVPRTLGALGLSTLSEQRGRFFPCHREQLDTDDDYDEWVYAPLRHRGKQRTLSFQFVCLFVVSPVENNRGLHFVEGFIMTGRGILNGPPLWALREGVRVIDRVWGRGHCHCTCNSVIFILTILVFKSSVRYF